MAVDDDREGIRRRYLDVDSSNVADVLDELGLVDQGLAPSFRPFPASAGRLAGWAFTISGEMAESSPTGGDPGEDGRLLEADCRVRSRCGAEREKACASSAS